MDERSIKDAAALKAFAHPLRTRLYDAVATRGSATAAMLAAATGEPPSLVSYHLRQLARHGFLEIAADLARDNRERVWRVTPGAWGWSSAEFTEGAAYTASVAAQRALLAQQLEKLDGWLTEQTTYGQEWLAAGYSSNLRLRLTPGELTELAAELGEVFARWSAATKDRPVPDGDRQHVFAFAHAFPYRA